MSKLADSIQKAISAALIENNRRYRRVGHLMQGTKNLSIVIAISLLQVFMAKPALAEATLANDPVSFEKGAASAAQSAESEPESSPTIRLRALLQLGAGSDKPLIRFSADGQI